DDLVSQEILDLVSASAQVRSVHKLGMQPGSLQQRIYSLLISAAREGHQVVRLRAISLLPFSQADEETEALAQAGVDFEVITGADGSHNRPLQTIPHRFFKLYLRSNLKEMDRLNCSCKEHDIDSSFGNRCYGGPKRRQIVR